MTRNTTRILVIGDTHGVRDALDTVVSEVASVSWDGVLLVGDLASGVGGKNPPLDAVEEELRFARKALERLHAPVLWVPGNHDPRELDGEGAVDRRAADLAGLRVFGVGGAGPAKFGFPYEWDEEEIDALDPPDHDVLLSHAPPRGARDRVRWGLRVGSRAVARLATTRARVTVCGHIHEAAGVERLKGRLVLNAGALGPPFAALQYGELSVTDGRITARHVHLQTGKEQALTEL